MKDLMKQIKIKFEENSFQNIVWWINLFPRVFGFSYFTGKVVGPFWIFLLSCTFYLDFVGFVSFHMFHADGIIDMLNSCFSISLLVIIYNTGRWMIFERNGLRKVLELAKKNNNMAMQFESTIPKHTSLIKSMKNLVIVCYFFHFINDFIVFTPQRLSKIGDFSVTSCVGMEPLKNSPNREICTTFFILQAIFGIGVTASYDATFLFIFAHTAAMFEILQEETMSLNDQEITTVAGMIKNLVHRHSLILHTVKEIQNIYSVTIGVSFGLEAISMCIFFVLPLNLAFNFTPIILHGFFVFFLYCYQGQKITTAAERFQTAVYFCGWENFKIKEQKMVLIMLRQSQMPVVLKAGSLVPVCIYTFASTLQSIYKFVTAFKT
ncbi:PREDICTED: odorant receptor 10a-like [Papilio polytes]|uniref:odorant receptor 10a-like n=1 Tax=Papilio polytes TaxID=76194 RepID=UPI000675D0CF|nr:PREDICTED: odorant receptor 10a-like [Papilio polytes]WCC57602.1 odorant receptor 19 [Papilio polytes]